MEDDNIDTSKPLEAYRIQDHLRQHSFTARLVTRSLYADTVDLRKCLGGSDLDVIFQ
jgi:hypothetical protein